MAAELSVTARSDGAFDVDVRENGTSTHHVVTVPDGLAAALGAEDLDPGELVRVSFEFLLEREPPSSILRRFDLDVIGHYFPEYRRDLTRRLPDR